MTISCFSRKIFIFVAVIISKGTKKMEIFYKAKAIDYEKTLGQLKKEQYVIIPTSEWDITNIRNSVSKVSRRLNGMSFVVNKTINGAMITRTG